MSIHRAACVLVLVVAALCPANSFISSAKTYGMSCPSTTCRLPRSCQQLTRSLRAVVIDDERRETLDITTGATDVLTRPPRKIASLPIQTELPPAKESSVPQEDHTIYKALLLVVAALWGSNFASIKILEQSIDSASVAAAARFGIAGLAMLPLLIGKPWDVVKAGLQCGLWISFGYFTQAQGLRDAPANTAAFICSLQVVLVPMVLGLLGKKVNKNVWIAAGLAVLGVGLLELGDGTSMGPSIGDLWCLGQPIGFGTSYVVIERLMQKFPDQALTLAAGQVAAVGLTSVIWSIYDVLSTNKVPDISPMLQGTNLLALLHTSLITTALAVFIQTKAMGKVPATASAVIFSSEPVWAALFSAVTIGEKMTQQSVIGGLMILTACLFAEGVGFKWPTADDGNI